MAETLSVTDMLPNKFEPKSKFRWIFCIDGIDSFLMREAVRPKMENDVQELGWINATRYVAGKWKFGEMSITLNDAIAPSGAQQVMEWIRLHYESVSGRAGYADFYKRDVQVKILDPIGTVVELWDLKGCLIKSVDFMDLKYDSSEVQTIQLVIQPDNAILQF
jgi:hypothetical protein